MLVTVVGIRIRPPILVASMFFAFAWFFLFEEVLFDRQILSNAVVAVVSVSLMFVWFLLDSRERSKKISLVLKVAVVVLPVFAIPYYKVKYDGWLPAVRFTGVFFALLLVLPIVVALTLGIGIEY